MAARYGNLGTVLLHQGKYEMALGQFEKCLAIQSKALGKEHSSLATTHGNIGSVFLHQGKHEMALEEYTLSVAIYSNTGRVFGDARKIEVALEQYKQCVATLSAKVCQDARTASRISGACSREAGKGVFSRFREDTCADACG
mmetsp:Transcript_10086/g.24694  ORF Transcript_10086/g.24694 Transcript_10086/m.24694 type:complete len:142 (-) Transcript_10086:82-507(-)